MVFQFDFMELPTTAFVAATMLCNSRCVMCNIWKNKGADFLPVETYRKLPSSLKMIDITGGEPFLRPDLPDLVRVLKETCPHARLLITTNGFLPDKIASALPKILSADPNIAFRVSLDGWGKMHERIRRIPHAFDKVMKTIAILKDASVRDVGIIFTLMRQNKRDLLKVFRFCKSQSLNFSLNIVHDSPIHYGTGKVSLRPDPESVKSEFDYIFWHQLKSMNPKDWAKAWLNKNLYYYMSTHHRPLSCGAGESFFYLDPHANIYLCHLKNWPIGNLLKSDFRNIWESWEKKKLIMKARSCSDCLISCTAKDAIAKHKFKVALQLPGLMVSSLVEGRSS